MFEDVEGGRFNSEDVDFSVCESTSRQEYSTPHLTVYGDLSDDPERLAKFNAAAGTSAKASGAIRAAGGNLASNAPEPAGGAGSAPSRRTMPIFAKARAAYADVERRRAIMADVKVVALCFVIIVVLLAALSAGGF